MFETPFRRPRKINQSGQQFHADIDLSQDELDMLRAYGAGCSMLELSGAYQCNKATILRTIRELQKKLTSSARPLQETKNDAGNIQRV